VLFLILYEKTRSYYEKVFRFSYDGDHGSVD
jgi:hypothetical protein